MRHDFVIGRLAKIKCSVDINEDTGVLVVVQEGIKSPLAVVKWDVDALDAEAAARGRPRLQLTEAKAAREKQIAESIKARRKAKGIKEAPEPVPPAA
jgi:hypothetical protein